MNAARLPSGMRAGYRRFRELVRPAKRQPEVTVVRIAATHDDAVTTVKVVPSPAGVAMAEIEDESAQALIRLSSLAEDLGARADAGGIVDARLRHIEQVVRLAIVETARSGVTSVLQEG